MVEKDPVVIAGGGPVAMVLAVALYREGVPVIALETLHEPFMDQRAASHHPPTVEMLDRYAATDHRSVPWQAVQFTPNLRLCGSSCA